MMKKNKQSGFTIVELMIATLVFSVFLLLLASITVRIGKLYTKGTIASKTQEAARSIASDIARSIQLNAGDVRSGGGYICVGPKRYMFQTGRQVIDTGAFTYGDQVRHAIISDSYCASTFVVDLSSVNANQREMMPNNMRLANLTITPPAGSSGLFTINVRVVYGDNDLLNDPTGPTASCRFDSGTQYCSVSDLTVSVQKRL